MSQRNTITINDGAASPASHAFKPLSTAGADRWIEYYDGSGGGISSGRWILRIRSTMVTPTDTLRGNGAATAMNRIEFQVMLPVLETVGTSDSGYNAVPKPAYFSTYKGEFLLPDRSVQQDRKHLLAIVKNFLGSSVMSDAVHDLDVPY